MRCHMSPRVSHPPVTLGERGSLHHPQKVCGKTKGKTVKTFIQAPTPPPKARSSKLNERGEDVPSPELKALLESSETETTTPPPPKPASQTPESVRFNLD